MTESLTQAEVRKLMRGEYVPRKPAIPARGSFGTITITIPLPPQAMYPNARKHWKAKMKPKKKQREDAHYAARWALYGSAKFRSSAPRWKLAECQATFYLERRRDSDNLLAWLKATFDGLQDAGVVENDSGFVHLPPVQKTAKQAEGRREVVLTITERKA